MLKVVEEVTNKPGWWENVRKSHIAKKWKKEILALEWEDYLKYADFTPSMAALVRFKHTKSHAAHDIRFLWIPISLYVYLLI